MYKCPLSLLWLVPFIGACGGPEPPPEILAVLANDFDEMVDYLDHEGLETLPGSCWGSILQDSRGINALYYEFSEDGEFRYIIFVEAWTRDEQFQGQDMPYADLFALVPSGGLTGISTMLVVEEGTYAITDGSTVALTSTGAMTTVFGLTDYMDLEELGPIPYEVTIDGDYMSIRRVPVDEEDDEFATFHRFEECPSG